MLIICYLIDNYNDALYSLNKHLFANMIYLSLFSEMTTIIIIVYSKHAFGVFMYSI